MGDVDGWGLGRSYQHPFRFPTSGLYAHLKISGAGMAVPLDVAVGLLWQCSIPATARFFGSALGFSWSDLGVMWIRVHVIGAIGSMAVSKTVDAGSSPA